MINIKDNQLKLLRIEHIIFASYHNGLKEWLWGEDVKRYYVEWNKKNIYRLLWMV